MDFVESLQKEISDISRNAGAVYNLAAFCYMHLTKFLKRCGEENDEENGIDLDLYLSALLPDYNENNTEILENDNVLGKIFLDVYDQLSKSLTVTKEKCFKEIPGIIERQISELKKIKWAESRLKDYVLLDGYLDQRLIEELSVFYILRAVDKIAFEHDERYKSDYPDEPLNMLFRNEVKIYRKTRIDNVWGSDISDMLTVRGDFSRDKSINAYGFSGIIFYPEMKYNIKIHSFKPRKPFLGRKEGDNEARLKVMIAPLFSNLDTTLFPKDAGITFSVIHKQTYDKYALEMIKEYLLLAKKKEVNIIMFPEYSFTKNMVKELKKYLKTEKILEESRVFLIMAGSMWDLSSNNISVILNYDGKQLVETYKSNGFKKIEKETHYRITCNEALRNPGKEVQVLDYKGIGRIATLICRDVYDRDHDSVINLLKDYFEPTFYLVPAWSPSFEKAFYDGFKEISKHGAVAILANSCEAVMSSLKRFNMTEGYNPEAGSVEEENWNARKVRGVCACPQSIETGDKEGSVVGKFDCAYGNIIPCKYNVCAFLLSMVFSDNTLRTGSCIEKVEHINLTGKIFNKEIKYVEC